MAWCVLLNKNTTSSPCHWRSFSSGFSEVAAVANCWGNLLQFLTMRMIPSLKLENKAPENGWVEDALPYCQVRTVSFRACNYISQLQKKTLGPYLCILNICYSSFGCSSLLIPIQKPNLHKRILIQPGSLAHSAIPGEGELWIFALPTQGRQVKPAS